MSTAPYHHGDLKSAILDVAEEVLSETSLETVSMRELARKAGVSSGAPYHHFKDRSGLIVALCQRGFSRLGHALDAARGNNGMRGMIDAYLEFAQSNPALYQLMFSAEATIGDRKEALHPFASPLFALLEEEIAHSKEGAFSRDGGDLTAISVWCFMHGLASLSAASPLRVKLDQRSASDFAHGVIGRLVENRNQQIE